MVSKYGDGADILFRMALDGHKVMLYISDPKFQENYDGVVPKCLDWKKGAAWADLVVFDDNKCTPIWQAVHKAVPCFGGSVFGERLENDRAFAHGLLERAGVERNEFKSAKTLKEVLPHLREHKVPHVIKPQGPKVESHHLIIGEASDNSDSIAQVERLIAQGLVVESVEFEERKRGVEVALTMFFNGMDQVGPILINFEHKRSHDGEVGYLTGEMGTLARFVEDPELPLFQETLAKVIPALRAANYRGIIDLNLIVGEDETGRFVCTIEFTPRPGKPTAFLMDELHVTPWAEILYGVATGKNVPVQVRFDWAVGVVLTGFGFPFEDQARKISQGLIVEGLDADSLAHIHPQQLKLDNKGRFVVGQGEAYLLTATGRGESIMDAKDRAYSELGRVRVPNSFHRWDISEKIDRYRLDRLGILPLEEGAVR